MTLRNLVHFNLSESGISREEFDQFVNLVHNSREIRRKDCRRDEVRLWLVTDQVDELGTINASHAKKRIARGTVGLCFKDGLIWVDPRAGVPEDRQEARRREVRVTLIHELSHAYVRSQSHGPKWRHVFGVAYAAWLRSEGLDEKDIRYWVRTNCCRRYTQYRRYTPQGRLNWWEDYQEKVTAETRRLTTISKLVEF